MRALADRSRGFTLIELMIGVALVGVLAGLSITSYRDYVEKARVARAVAEIKSMATAIESLSPDGISMPDTLADAGLSTIHDPWGQPYQYLRIEGMGFTSTGRGLPHVAAPPGSPPKGPLTKPKKDKFLKPVNSDFDLFSMGPDGETHFNMANKLGQDDVVRALDGAFIGLAALFEAK